MRRWHMQGELRSLIGVCWSTPANCRGCRGGEQRCAASNRQWRGAAAAARHRHGGGGHQRAIAAGGPGSRQRPPAVARSGELSDAGQRVIGEACRDMGGGADAVRHSSGVIDELSTYSQRIAEIVNVIGRYCRPDQFAGAECVDRGRSGRRAGRDLPWSPTRCVVGKHRLVYWPDFRRNRRRAAGLRNALADMATASQRCSRGSSE